LKLQYSNTAPSLKRSAPERQIGLSLIELLIAMALGLLLTLGVTQIYLSGDDSYRQTQGLSYAQESTRFVSSILKPDIRSAGSFGCLAEMGRPLDQVVENRLNAGPVVPAAQAVQGWEFDNTGPGDNTDLLPGSLFGVAGDWSSGTAGTALPAALTGSVLVYSDVIILNALSFVSEPTNAVTGAGQLTLANPSDVPANRVMLATAEDCSEGELFQKTDGAGAATITMAGAGGNPGNTSNTFNNTNYGPQTRVYEFVSTAFYVGQGTNGEPALFRRLMTPLQPPQELVSGVETLQILYGVDTGGTSAADTYVAADQVNDWQDVVSVRFSVMTRSQDEVLDEPNTRNFDMLGSRFFQPNNTADGRVRVVSVATVAMRARM